MNKHIELVKQWLEDKDSVSLEELEANKESAYSAYRAAEAVYFYYAADNAAADAAYWIEKYEELTK